jgi:hypothetical protein
MFSVAARSTFFLGGILTVFVMWCLVIVVEADTMNFRPEMSKVLWTELT